MRRLGLILALLLLLPIGGCVVVSFHPFYTSRNVVFDPGLLGKWSYIPKELEKGQADLCSEAMKKDSDICSLVFNVNTTTDLVFLPEKTYELVFRETGGRDTRVRGVLIQVNQDRFLDLYLTHDSLDDMPFLANLLVPVHVLVKVVEKDRSITLVPIKRGWLKQLLARRKNRKLSFVADQDYLLLISSSPEELLRYLNDPIAFSPEDAITWQRK